MKKLLFIGLLFASSAAMADYFSQSFNTYYAPTYFANQANISSAALQNIKNRAYDNLAEQQTGTSNSGASEKAPAKMSFVPSKAVSNKTADLVLADIARNAGVTLNQVKAQLAAKGETNFGPQMINESIKGLGLPQNDLTSSLTVFCIFAHRNVLGNLPPKGSAKVMYDKLARSFGSKDAFGSFDNDQRQAFADYLAWMSVLMLQHKNRDPVAAKKSTLQLLNEFGLDQEKLERLSRA
jgi:hypothetical protein